MSYSAIEQGVLDALLACPAPDFDAQSAKRNDWKVLDTARTGTAAHVGMGEESSYGPEVALRTAGRYGEHGLTSARHVVAVTVAVPRRTGVGGDAAALTTLLTATDDLVAYLGPAARAISGVIDADVIRASTPRELLRVGEQVGTHVGQRILIEVLEEVE